MKLYILVNAMIRGDHVELAIDDLTCPK